MSEIQGFGENLLKVELIETDDRMCVISALDNFKQQEDTKIVALDQPVDIYAVFDGHGWDQAMNKGMTLNTSTLLEKEMLDWILKYISPFLGEDDRVLKEMKRAIIDYDRELFNRTGVHQDGSTGVIVVQDGSKFYIANVGDSRAIMFNRRGLIFETIDHKPDEPNEKIRIESVGGQVNPPDRYSSVYRVNHRGHTNGLAVSRGFGDFLWKISGTYSEPIYNETDSIVSPEPEMTMVTGVTGDYLVIATDGLWDVLTSQEVADIVINSKEFKNVGETLSQEAVDRKSHDNITIIAIKFKDPPIYK